MAPGNKAPTARDIESQIRDYRVRIIGGRITTSTRDGTTTFSLHVPRG